ncbi:MAG: 16S rRNA (guanine(527)-N(7))-methyltransferase RsmG [Nitriliruptoraceae bacterium]
MDVDAKLAEYARMLRASPHNLMSPRALQELEGRHLPEARAVGALLPAPSPQGGRVLDVGSGGGLPGIVVAITRTDLMVDLLESRSKKVRFLTAVVDRLALPSQVHEGRAEDLARTELARTYDVVTARAVAPLPRLLGWTLPFLRPGGLLYAVKGERWRAEVAEAADQLVRWQASVVVTPSDQSGPHDAVQIVVVRRDVA